MYRLDAIISPTWSLPRSSLHQFHQKKALVATGDWWSSCSIPERRQSRIENVRTLASTSPTYIPTRTLPFTAFSTYCIGYWSRRDDWFHSRNRKVTIDASRCCLGSRFHPRDEKTVIRSWLLCWERDYWA